MHPLLERQVRKHFPCGPPDSLEFRAFVEAISGAYRQADADRNMTERSLELMSSELLERNERLQRDLAAIQRLEVELRQADKLGAVGRLASGIAHEINTPIQFVGDSIAFLKDACSDLVALISESRAAAGALLQGADPKAALAQFGAMSEEMEVDMLLSDVPGALDRAAEGVLRVAQIVMAMKEFGRPDQREPTLVDVNRGLMNTLTVARSEIKYCADVELSLGTLPFISGYPGELGQVFLNLLVNAAHAIAERFTAPERGRITVKSAHEGESIVVEIADNGAGIRTEHRPRIFEPFFTTKGVGKGTGQGLAIAHSIVVDKHAGSLSFTSEVGQGTTFVIRLPLVGPESVRSNRRLAGRPFEPG